MAEPIFSWESTVISIFAIVISILLIELFIRQFTRTQFDPTGKHCFITGGSTGLGKALAVELVKLGADITIIARRKEELINAVSEIKNKKRDPCQKVTYVSADVTSKKDIVKAFDEAKAAIGRDPEYVFACAGASFPKYFVDHTLEDFEFLINLNYLGQAYVAHQATIRMKNNNVKHGKIVFISSVLGLMSFVGYAAYSPTKYAIRGLADTLRNELKKYCIDVHIFYPGGIKTPGFEVENKTKPQITKDIEGINIPQTPEECAISLIRGLKAGYYNITTELLIEILRSTGRGVSPTNCFFIDWIYAGIGWIFSSAFNFYMDYLVKSQK